MPIGVVATDGGTPVAGLQVRFEFTNPPFSIGNFTYTTATDAQGIARLSPDITSVSTTPGTFTPIGMFSRRASTSPDPAIIITRSGRVGGSMIGFADGGTCRAWITV